MHAQRNLIALKQVGEVEIGGGVVGWVPAQNHQQIHLTAAHVGDQVFHRLSLIDRIGIYGVAVKQRLTDIA